MCRSVQPPPARSARIARAAAAARRTSPHPTAGATIDPTRPDSALRRGRDSRLHSVGSPTRPDAVDDRQQHAHDGIDADGRSRLIRDEAHTRLARSAVENELSEKQASKQPAATREGELSELLGTKERCSLLLSQVSRDKPEGAGVTRPSWRRIK